ncbi:hypothetical protein B0H11DRAFT_2031369 [Mycena galericulata]|nr:hypothetical protein B0H11DRAFT_2031369 [Mycena galericulata]
MPRTPVEAIADQLPPNHPLLTPMYSRMRIPLSSSPEDLLGQLDDEPHWSPISVDYPSFPDNYPPDLPPSLSATLVCRAFTSGENAVLEWLGDALIAATLIACLSTSEADCSTPINHVVLRTLAGYRFLGHLALLYGLQLYDCNRRCREDMPSMERMCDVFESLIGAAALDSGFVHTLDWLKRLFEPWTTALCKTGNARPRRADRVRYRALMLSLGDGPPMPSSDSLHDIFTTVAAEVGSQFPGGHVLARLSTFWPGWAHLDASKVSFSKEYPPTIPLSTGSATVAHVFTDALCHIHAGTDFTSSERHRLLGDRLCALVVTAAAVEELPDATPAQLDDVRVECMNPDLLAYFGLFLRLDSHLHVLRRAGNAPSIIHPHESMDAFFRIVGVIYQQLGWNDLFKWLKAIFLPFIIAAGNGRFNASPIAHKLRQGRLEQRRQADAKKAERKQATADAQKAQMEVQKQEELARKVHAPKAAEVQQRKKVRDRYKTMPRSIKNSARVSKSQAGIGRRAQHCPQRTLRSVQGRA